MSPNALKFYYILVVVDIILPRPSLSPESMPFLNWHFSILYSSGPQPFWHQRQVLWKTIFPWTKGVGMVWGWFGDDSRALYLLCTLFLLLLHQLLIRSSGIHSWSTGTPALEAEHSFSAHCFGCASSDLRLQGGALQLSVLPCGHFAITVRRTCSG